MNRIIDSGYRTHTSDFQRSIALLLCFSIAAVSGKGFAQVKAANTADRVGRVAGILLPVTKNGSRIGLKDVIQSNDEISTHNSGRIGIELQDGSILNAGSGTQFRVARHDPQTGETLVDLTAGSLRSRVVSLRHSGQFKIATPQSTISAMGTDFFVNVSPDQTQLVVYSGVVIVTSASTLPDSATKLMLDVAAGENVLINANGIAQLQSTETGLEQQTMAQTAIPETAAPAVAEGLVSPGKSSHTTRNILIGGLAAGAIVGAVVGLRGSKSQPTTSTSTIPPTIPPH
jgi:ferric-dicitrate binding protein FerR (iron transport regulator)